MNSKTPLIVLLLAAPFIAGAAHVTVQPDTSRVETTRTFCEAGETQSSKYIASADAFVLSCDCDCTAQENRIWIIPGKTRQAYQLDASNAVSTLELNGLDAISDTFGPVPLCEKQQSASSSITILTKMPSTSGASPYCYSAEPFIEQNSTQCVSAECKKVLASLGGSSKPPQAQTLCRKEESTALGFKIAQKNKLVSLCVGADNSYLVYRYGTAGKIELQYPEQPDASSWELFELQRNACGVGEANGDNGLSIAFNNHSVTYVVHQGWQSSANAEGPTITIDTGKKKLVLGGDKDTQVGSLQRLARKPGLNVRDCQQENGTLK